MFKCDTCGKIINVFRGFYSYYDNGVKKNQCFKCEDIRHEERKSLVDKIKSEIQTLKNEGYNVSELEKMIEDLK